MNELLKQIADNPKLFEALREFVSANLAPYPLEEDLKKPNNELGEIIRAKAEAQKMVNEIFKKLLAFKTEKPRPSKINEAR